MNTRKIIGIIVMVLLLLLCAVLMVLRVSAAKASDAAALRESMATFKTDHCIWMGFCYAAGYSTAW